VLQYLELESDAAAQVSRQAEGWQEPEVGSLEEGLEAGELAAQSMEGLELLRQMEEVTLEVCQEVRLEDQSGRVGF